MPRILLGRVAVGLPLGPAELVGEAHVTLARDGRARAHADGGAVVVELAAGRIELEVVKRDPSLAGTFDVVAGSYHFGVLGTRFEVTESPARVALMVFEGRVAVSRAGRTLAVIGAGDSWESSGGPSASREEGGPSPGDDRAAMSGGPAKPGSEAPVAAGAGPSLGLSPPAFAPAPTPPAVALLPPAPASGISPFPARSPVAPATLGHVPLSAAVRGSDPARIRSACAEKTGPRAALDCYLREARGEGVGAEVALYEAARLRRDALSDPAGALAALTEHRRRFPSGALATEVEISVAELLPTLGRYREALAAVDGLLRAHPEGERVGELQLLRGHIFREGFHDFRAAERAYQTAAESDGPDGRAAERAAFWRAACLEKLERWEEARLAYRAYLSRPDAGSAAEAEQRLRALDREHPTPVPAPIKAGAHP